MSIAQRSYVYKGDIFRNRYRITGKIQTLSPLHIGSGTSRLEIENGQQSMSTNKNDQIEPENYHIWL